jgi:hypothetical protein
LAVNVGTAGAFVVLNGAGGTPSSMTGTNITGIPEAGVTFATNDGSRHDHVAADISNQNAGTDITADLEEETHASEHEDAGADEIAVTAGMMNAGTGATANTVWHGDNTWDQIQNAEIADDQIDSEHYVAGSIDNEHLADNAVNTDEIAAAAVTEPKLGFEDWRVYLAFPDTFSTVCEDTLWIPSHYSSTFTITYIKAMSDVDNATFRLVKISEDGTSPVFIDEITTATDMPNSKFWGEEATITAGTFAADDWLGVTGYTENANFVSLLILGTR